jgi:hypothetical protein
MESENKVCTGCGQRKILSDFPIEKRKGVCKITTKCRICVNKQKAEYKRRKKEEAYQQRVASGEVILPADPINNFICKQCHVERPKDMFCQDRWKCIECERADGRAYRQSEVGKEKSAQWITNNQERMTQLQAEWYQRNKEKRNEEYNRRYHSDPVFKFKVSCKGRIHSAFNAKGMQKSNRTLEYLNCSIPWLMAWFEYNFNPGMTFENHGPYWHMDHVIPINLFDLTDPMHVLLCFSWFNLSPLEANSNMSKHDTIDTEQIKRHVQNLINFTFEINYNIEPYIDLYARYLRMSGSPLELYLPLLQGNL